MIPKPLDDITSDDLYRLKEEKEPESRTLEYKRELPEKWKTLKSLCSFANTGTGDILIGIEEDGQHYAKDIVGIPAEEIEVAKSKIEQWARSGLEPALINFQIQPVPISEGSVLVVRVWRSWAGPHRVKEGGRFYGRHSEGSYELSMEELRRAFTEFDGLLERMKRFREERTRIVIDNDTPVQMDAGPKLMLHLVPLSAFSGREEIDLAVAHKTFFEGVSALGIKIDHRQFNFNGVVGSSPISGTSSHTAYVQVFRSGVIEAVRILNGRDEGTIVAPEPKVFPSIGGFLSLLQKLQVPPPLFVFISLTGVRDHHLSYAADEGWVEKTEATIATFFLLRPEVEFRTLDSEAHKALKPAFDAFWNAFNFLRSPLIDDEGNYISKR